MELGFNLFDVDIILLLSGTLFPVISISSILYHFLIVSMFSLIEWFCGISKFFLKLWSYWFKVRLLFKLNQFTATLTIIGLTILYLWTLIRWFIAGFDSVCRVLNALHQCYFFYSLLILLKTNVQNRSLTSASLKVQYT